MNLKPSLGNVHPDYKVKGTVSRDFLLQVYFHESSSPNPKPPKISLGSFQIFLQTCGIFANEGAPPVSTTSMANFAAGVIFTSGKFATSIKDTGGKFCHWYRWCC
jgi:hypothetical protein